MGFATISLRDVEMVCARAAGLRALASLTAQVV
jgi:hypothetical protein